MCGFTNVHENTIHHMRDVMVQMAVLYWLYNLGRYMRSPEYHNMQMVKLLGWDEV